MSTKPHLRASDADRDRVVAALQRHTAAGLLSLDEFAERVDRVLLARTHGELVAVVHDLPSVPADESTVEHLEGARHLLLAFLVALVALAVIGLAVGLLR